MDADKGVRTMDSIADKYTYRVTWSDEDGEHVGLCVEFPSLSWLAKTKEKALRGIGELVAETTADMRARGEAVPQPIATHGYSGAFKVRIPAALHRRLAMEAAEYAVSLNRLVSMKLANTEEPGRTFASRVSVAKPGVARPRQPKRKSTRRSSKSAVGASR
jgi:predicted HicB family RNase H-like nuclease